MTICCTDRECIRSFDRSQVFHPAPCPRAESSRAELLPSIAIAVAFLYRGLCIQRATLQPRCRLRRSKCGGDTSGRTQAWFMARILDRPAHPQYKWQRTTPRNPTLLAAAPPPHSSNPGTRSFSVCCHRSGAGIGQNHSTLRTSQPSRQQPPASASVRIPESLTTPRPERYHALRRGSDYAVNSRCLGAGGVVRGSFAPACCCRKSCPAIPKRRSGHDCRARWCCRRLSPATAPFRTSN